MNTRARLASNTLYNLINSTLAGIFGIATSIITARVLGSTLLGEYSYILWLIGILTLIINAGLPMAVTKYIAEYAGKNDLAAARGIFSAVLRLEIVSSIIVSLLLASISYLLSSETLRMSLLLLSSINIIPIALSRIYYSAAAGLQKYRILAKASLITSPIQFMLILLTLLSGYSVTGLITANIIGSVLNLSILGYFIKREFKGIPGQTPLLDISLKKRITKYSLGVSGIILIDAVVWQKSEVFFLERFSSAPEIAFYSLAFTIGYMAMQIPAVFSSLLMPYFSEIYGQGDKKRLADGYTDSTRYLAFIAFPIGICGAALSAPLIELVYGREYIGASLPAQIILIINSFGAVSRASSSILYGTEEQSFILKWGSVIAVLNIMLDFLLIPRYGAIGAAIANSSAQMAGVIGGAVYVSRGFDIPYPLRPVLKIFASSVLTGLCIYTAYTLLNGYTGIMLSILLSPFVYFVSLFIFGAIDERDRNLVKGLLKRAGL
ncbi:MAG: flippase [Nitrospinae bacterium]|nr:flippase [Nitrospinota bacterium]